MKYLKRLVVPTLSAILLCLMCLAVFAQSQASVSVTTAGKSLSELLPDSLGGERASSSLSVFSSGNLSEIVGKKSSIYNEYRVLSAASRNYGAYRVEVFKAESQYSAFGLLTYNSSEPLNKDSLGGVGSGSVSNPKGFNLWQGRYFVRISPLHGRLTAAALNSARKLAGAISSIIGPGEEPRATPFLLDNLPLEGGTVPPARYVLGPETLNEYVTHGSDIFAFSGDAEAAIANYSNGPPDSKSKFQLVMVEYDTPQFASDELKRAEAYVASLPPDQQSKMIIKRIGNYIVEANGITERDSARRVVDSITYPYTVKMLRNPRSPDPDPNYGQKAAQVLLSTLGIIGLLLGAALMGGVGFGTVVFFRRRKNLRGVFSDAGGMLRIDIEPLGAAGDHIMTGRSAQALKGGGQE